MLALSKILKDKGINFYQSGKFNLDSTFYESFQDEGEVFDQVFETDHKDGDIISLTGNIPKSLFKYFWMALERHIKSEIPPLIINSFQ